MNKLFKISIVLVFMGFSFESFSQRITVRRADGTVENSEGSTYQNSGSKNNPFAAKFHLSNIIFGEYLGSVEYAVTDFFTIEGGIGTTYHGGNIFAGADFLFQGYPSGDRESRGLGLSYLGEMRLYSGQDALETDQYYGIGIHSKEYIYEELFYNVIPTQDYNRSTRFTDYYFFYGYSMEFDDHILLQLNVDIGMRRLKHQGFRENYNANTGGYEIFSEEDDDVGFLYGLHVTLGYVFN